MNTIVSFFAFCVAFTLVPNEDSVANTNESKTWFPPSSYRSAADQVIRSPEAVEQFYQENGTRPVWSTKNWQLVKDLQATINDVEAHGLMRRDYHAEALSDALASNDRAAIELLATDAYLTLGAHLLRGKLDPIAVEPFWTAKRRSTDLIQHLSAAIKRGRIRQSLEALSPNVRAYRVLQGALLEYTKELELGDRPEVPDGPSLKLGMRGPRVAALRKRLEAEGFVQTATASATDLFDSEIEAAVGMFQRRIGLEADGVVGPLTLRELNRSIAERAAQIRANLERWRWLDESLGPRHIRVNIADFSLEAWENGHPKRVHEVIVGRTYRKTPIFSDTISFVVLNPWWETPRNIARLDKLPAFQTDPGSVTRLGFDVLDQKGKLLGPSTIDWRSFSAKNFPFRLRQRPGPENALGKVKLMFPNRHNVYLHDTPTQELFNRTRRDFSSGCIRVRRALDLTEWVLSRTPGWNRTKIEAAVSSGRETRVNLVSNIPVHILYMTVVPSSADGIRFLSDVYDRDRRLISALNTPFGHR